MTPEHLPETTGAESQDSASSVFSNMFEVIMPLLAVALIVMGWVLCIGYEKTLINAVVASYQETQLEVVRSVARSIQPFVEARLAEGRDIRTVEQDILKRFVEPVHLLQNGDAWIYAPDHVVFDLSSDFPEAYRGKSMDRIFAIQKDQGAYHYERMASDIGNAREGVGWYVWLPKKGREIAAWSPVSFGNHVWTIGLSTPLNEILQATGAHANTRLIFAVMTVASLFGGGLAMTSLLGSRRRRQLNRILQVRNTELQTLVANLEQEVALRTKTETEARQVGARLNTLVEAIPDVIYFKDAQGRNLVVNRAFERLVDRNKPGILGKTDGELLPSQLAEICARSDRQVLETKAPVRYEEVVRTPTGEIVHFDTFKAPLLDEQRNVVGLVGVNRDVTDIKNAEKERERLGQQLLQAQKMEALGALAGGVAHDLNNILSGLVSYPELLIYDLPPDSPMRGPLKTIQTSGERAAGIVQDLLTMARRGATDKQVLNMNGVIKEYLDSPAHRKRALERKEIRMELNLASDLMDINGAPSDLSKTVMNLVINAFEANEGAGTVTLSTSNEYIDAHKAGLTDVPEGEYVRLRVRDTGVGMDAEHLPRIFEPFYSKKKLGSSGSGLGLAVVWGTVQDHGGFIDVQSTRGRGSTFDIYFPVTRQQAQLVEDRVSIETYMGRGETILVVDDIAMQRELASTMLGKLGYLVHTVNSGEAAVKRMEHDAFDLIVLDMIMGDGMDGLDTYRRIVERHPGQKAVITSGFSETDRVREAQRLGAGAYVKKPFSIEVLGRAVRCELDRLDEREHPVHG